VAVHAHIVVPAKVMALRAASAAAAAAPTNKVAQQGHVRAGIVGVLALVGVLAVVLGPGIVRSSKTTVDVAPANEITVVSSSGAEIAQEARSPEPMIAVEGCGWFNSSGGAQTTVSGEQIAQCVFEQILQGVNDPGTIATACFNVAASQVLTIIDEILNFYTTATDAGAASMLCGTGAPPVVGANACVAVTTVANARAMRPVVAAKAAAGAH
jgi:hypothetical protein